MTDQKHPAPIVFHIPHASTHIPPDVRPQLTLSDAELAVELLRMTDLHTDAVFAAAAQDGDAVVKFPVSRLVLDPERFVDDAREPMSQRGMGVVYTRRHDGQALRANLDDKARLVRTYYHPHHAALSEAVDDRLAKYGKTLIVDCHSFPSSPLPYELNQNPDRPEICIGVDSFHTPCWLGKLLTDKFRSLGYLVRVNDPFAGTIAPGKHFERCENVWSAMIELRRDLYMDEATGALTTGAGKLSADVAEAIGALRAAGEWRLAREGQAKVS